MSLTALQYRILELSYKHGLSHIGSSLGCVGILDGIYTNRKPDEVCILSCGHAGLSLYTVLEKRLGKDAEDLLLRHGVHPTKNAADGIHASTGSLGMGLTLAVGHALAAPERITHCVISDGEAASGAVYEGLRFAAREQLTNLAVYAHLNGYAAYRPVDVMQEMVMLKTLLPWIRCVPCHPNSFAIPFLRGQDAHYYTQTAADWEWVQAQEVKR